MFAYYIIPLSETDNGDTETSEQFHIIVIKGELYKFLAVLRASDCFTGSPSRLQDSQELNLSLN